MYIAEQTRVNHVDHGFKFYHQTLIYFLMSIDIWLFHINRLERIYPCLGLTHLLHIKDFEQYNAVFSIETGTSWADSCWYLWYLYWSMLYIQLYISRNDGPISVKISFQTMQIMIPSRLQSDWPAAYCNLHHTSMLGDKGRKDNNVVYPDIYLHRRFFIVMLPVSPVSQWEAKTTLASTL